MDELIVAKKQFVDIFYGCEYTDTIKQTFDDMINPIFNKFTNGVDIGSNLILKRGYIVVDNNIIVDVVFVTHSITIYTLGTCFLH